MRSWAAQIALGRRVSHRVVSGAALAVVSAIAVAAVAMTANTAPMGDASPTPSAPTPPTEPIVPVPANLLLDSKRVTLGERLFHDERLSRDEGRSCATCHPLDRGGMDG